MSLQDLRARADKIEECYEFMLAYAARGLPGEAGDASVEQMRHLLGQAVEALAGLPDAYRAAIEGSSGLEPADKHRAFLAVLERDLLDALAAMQLVKAQATLSSQLIDNLNASSHLRALLTDLFLIDEIAARAESAVPKQT